MGFFQATLKKASSLEMPLKISFLNATSLSDISYLLIEQRIFHFSCQKTSNSKGKNPPGLKNSRRTF